MLSLLQFPTQQLPAGRSFFRKGQFFNHLYYLQEGKARVIINQISIQISTPMFLGDYQILTGIQYRISMIKAITKCKIKIIPIEYYNKFQHEHQCLDKSFKKFNLKHKTLCYWLKKLFAVSYHNKNDVVNCENSIGIVLQGEFKHESKIPIVNMRQRNFHLLRKFEISIIGMHQIFQENVICQTSRGKVGIIIQKYISQLSVNFQEFDGILSVSKFKKIMHSNLTKQIAYNCRKKRNLFQNMIPITLKSSIQRQTYLSEANKLQTLPEKKSEYGISKLEDSENVFSVKDNIGQFLHKQWRKGLSLSLPKKSSVSFKLNNITPLRKQKIQDFNNPQTIKLTIPHQFQDNKFNFKMLLKSKANSFMRSKRMKTQPTQNKRRSKLFQD